MSSFKRYYSGTSVSRDLQPGDYAWEGVVYESGRFVVDADLNLTQNAAVYDRAARDASTSASGFLRTPGVGKAWEDYSFYSSPLISDYANRFQLRARELRVAGMRVSFEYTASTTAGTNLVTLPAASPSSGLAPDVKRTDFVFLEVWRALVAPSPRATGSVEVSDPQTITAGDTFTLDLTGLPSPGPAVTFTARAVAGSATEFTIGASAESTAAALAAAINNPANGLSTFLVATTSATSLVTMVSLEGGTGSNSINMAVVETVPSSMVPSGLVFTGGATRPNKPSDTTIYRKGNVMAPAGVNLTDDLIDDQIGVESSQRVQIQYRLRVYSSNLNPKTNPDGFSHAGVLAQGPLGSVSAYRYAPADGASVVTNAGKTSSAAAYGWADGGLWVAGDGTSTAAGDLGTVDGYVYAIPVCLVFRKNDASLTGGFNPTANANGALSFLHSGSSNTHLSAAGPVAISAGKSDRPDGGFHDLIGPGDVLDLRRHLAPAGYDLTAELTRQSQILLDGALATWAVDSSDMGLVGSGSGHMSPQPLNCNEIGRSGAPDFSGDAIRKFDHIARRFASQSICERVVFELSPTAVLPTGITLTKAGGAVNWHEGDSISLDFALLNPSTRTDWKVPDAPGATVVANWPAGTRVTDVLECWHDDGHSVTPVAQEVQWSSIQGVGTSLLTLVLDSNRLTVDEGGLSSDHPLVDEGAGDTGSPRRLFIELEVTYPTGAGLVRTPLANTAQPDTSTGYAPYEGGPVVEPDPAQRPSEMEPAWVPRPRFREGFREVSLEMKAGAIGAPGSVVADTLVTRSSTTLKLPRRLQTLTGCTVAGTPVVTATVGSSESLVTLPVPVTGQVAVAVNWYAQDPIPDAGAGGYQLNVYYQSRAPQTAGVQSGPLPTTQLPETFYLDPVASLPYVWSGQAGAGSGQLSYPYASPLEAIPFPDLGGGTPKDWFWAATAQVDLNGFSLGTGLVTVPVHVPLDMATRIQLGGPARGPQTDPEFRAYYDQVNPSGYRPAVWAAPLAHAVRHKVWCTLLARVREDTRLFRRGELVLVVMARMAELDAQNSIRFTDVPATRTVAALYRTQDLLLTPDP